ncbi:MAG: hypothetical protein LBC62_01200, partial [Treponema sp.]|nr:hypothetical protein [Treponema sp.]
IKEDKIVFMIHYMSCVHVTSPPFAAGFFCRIILTGCKDKNRIPQDYLPVKSFFKKITNV